MAWPAALEALAVETEEVSEEVSGTAPDAAAAAAAALSAMCCTQNALQRSAAKLGSDSSACITAFM